MKRYEIDKNLLKEPVIDKHAFQISHHGKRSIIINWLVTIGFMTLATLLSFLFRYIGFHESNIIIAYILGVLFVAKQTDTYFYGILASAIGVMTFNFFFTEPYYTFVAYRADYPVTFIIMLIAAIITSTMTAKIKGEARLSLIREERTLMLYEISKNLLKARTSNEIADIASNAVAKLFDGSVVIILKNLSQASKKPSFYYSNSTSAENLLLSINNKEENIFQLFEARNSEGASIDFYKENDTFYLPVQGQYGILGIVAVSCFNGRELSVEQKVIFKAVALQIAVALEREHLSEQQQKSKLDVERERLRGNLLRAISHDLRTPLTGILGATATIIENEAVLEDKVKRELLQDIYEQTSWLSHSVENILNMTRIEEGRLDIRKRLEAVEEVVASAVSRVKKLSGNHRFKISMPEKLLMIPMEGTLIEQVMINLLDNAIKYTPVGSTINIKVYEEESCVVFEVSDNGRGIPEEVIPHIFDRFYTAVEKVNVRRRGIGLGLAICKSIIKLHNGEIFAYNNSSGGATFKFILPAKE